MENEAVERYSFHFSFKKVGSKGQVLYTVVARRRCRIYKTKLLLGNSKLFRDVNVRSTNCSVLRANTYAS